MAKATVLKCDRCDEWDSVDTRVRPMGVCGPKFDLCFQCRVDLLIFCRVTPDKANRYLLLSDERMSTRGTAPSLASLLKNADLSPDELADQAAGEPAGAGVPEEDPAIFPDEAELPSQLDAEVVVDSPVGEETGTAAEPAKRGARRR